MLRALSGRPPIDVERLRGAHAAILGTIVCAPRSSQDSPGMHHGSILHMGIHLQPLPGNGFAVEARCQPLPSSQPACGARIVRLPSPLLPHDLPTFASCTTPQSCGVIPDSLTRRIVSRPIRPSLGGFSHIGM